MQLRTCLAALAAFVMFATAPVARAARPTPTVEASLLVAGTIDIDARGNVVRYTLEDAPVLGKGVVDLVAGAVPQWHFQPYVVDGAPRAAHARMNLLLVATRTDAGIAIGLRNASFGNPDPTAGIAARGHKPPAYPHNLLRQGVSGTVYMVFRLDAEGRVAQAMAEQTNLRTTGSERDMAAWRRDLERAALVAARHWTFAVPPAEDDGLRERDVRVPVVFTMVGNDTYDAGAGHWNAYLPGPRTRAPWLEHEDLVAADAIPDNAVQEVGTGLKLLTPLNAS
jgi:TonB family protein